MQIITSDRIKALFPPRARDAHKGDFGRLLAITGSRNMSGATYFSAASALRSGVGLLTVATAGENAGRLTAAIPEAMWLPLFTDAEGFLRGAENSERLSAPLERSDAVLIGCGLGLTEGVHDLVQHVLLQARCPIVVDADALNVVAQDCTIIEKVKSPLIFTPHLGEMARLCHCSIAEIQANRESIALSFTQQYPITLVLKGSGTLIADDGHIIQNPTGNPGMSRGGSGDVLAGMVAAFLARGFSPWNAACAGVYLHGLAGDIAAQMYTPEAMLPRDIIASLPKAFAQILSE